MNVDGAGLFFIFVVVAGQDRPTVVMSAAKKVYTTPIGKPKNDIARPQKVRKLILRLKNAAGRD
ncbi:MAG: hypothetical protein ACE5F2_02535 [Candidatus Paceibacteria bacterium]